MSARSGFGRGAALASPDVTKSDATAKTQVRRLKKPPRAMGLFAMTILSMFA
jgi:hypothetical protein